MRAITLRALLGVALALAAVPRGAAAQSEGALRAAFEGKTVTVRLDMPATSQGVDVYPLDQVPLDVREVAQRLKDHGTALRIGQQAMVTRVVVKKSSHIEFQLGGGGYGTLGDWSGSSVTPVAAGETRGEKALRDSIKATSDRGQRQRLQRELDAQRSARERENARAAAEAQQANVARETLLRARRAESGSRFNLRFRQGIPPEQLTPDGVARALAQFVDFGPVAPAPTGVAALRKGLLVEQVEALLGPAATATESREGTLTLVRRTYRRDGMQVVARFVSDVLIDFAITPR